MAYRKLELIKLERGRALRNYEISRVQLINCTTAIDKADSLRPLVENVRVEKLKVRRSHLGFAVLRNVVFDGIDTDVFSSFLTANEYYGVTFRGRIHRELIFGIDALNEGLREGYAAALAEAQARPDWGIDISEMQGGVAVRGYAADGFTINPEFQCVVRNNPASLAGWEKLDYGRSLFNVGLQQMIDGAHQDTVLAANGNAEDYEDQVALVHLLREKGIAE